MATTGEIEGDGAVDTLHSFLPCWPRWGFEDRGQERLFQSYVRQIKWDAIDVVFVAGLVFDGYAILLHVLSGDKLSLLLLAVMTVAACVNSTMLVLFKRKVNFPTFYRLVPYVAWLFFMGQFYVVLLTGGEMLVPSSLVEWQLLSIYLVHAVLPVQTRMCLLLNVTSCVLLSFVSTRDYIESPIFKTANMVRKLNHCNTFLCITNININRRNELWGLVYITIIHTQFSYDWPNLLNPSKQ